MDPDAADHITLNQMFDKYYAQKYNLKETTRSNYKYIYFNFIGNFVLPLSEDES